MPFFVGWRVRFLGLSVVVLDSGIGFGRCFVLLRSVGRCPMLVVGVGCSGCRAF